jgi:hypothetical protein
VIEGYNTKLQTIPVDVNGNFQVALDSQSLAPGVTYEYNVIGTDASGKQYSCATKTFKTKGLTIRIVVRDKKGNLLRKTKVYLHSDVKTGTTDDQGVVEFTDVTAGTHHLTMDEKDTTGGNSDLAKVEVVKAITTVGNTQFADVQSFEVKLAKTATNGIPSSVWVALVTIGAVGILGMMFVLMRSGRKPRFPGGGSGGGGVYVSGTGQTAAAPPTVVTPPTVVPAPPSDETRQGPGSVIGPNS